MSLRIFHVIFIAVCISLSVWVAIWGVREFALSRSWNALALALVFVVCGGLLAVYAGRAFRKLRDL